ncbi:MAG: response regulator containing a CheY-like receiver domain and an domain [Acidobacteria bacterium]|nr:response regulator containing a CheY-like receiver domain and an domain [Acidobacteriota bacterium]
MSPKRILIIDDEDDIREVAAITLEIGGFEVLTASTGRKGIECAAAEQPDAILLDVMMPELDGPATFAMLRQFQATRDIPVIFLTAKVQSADRRCLGSLGARAIMAKPFDPNSLASDISAALGW